VTYASAMARSAVSYTPEVRRRMPADQRREQLLDTARRVIARSGLSALTIDAVAAEGDVSRGLVYQHFGDRDALLMALLEAEWTWLNERILPALEADDGADLVDRVMLAVRPYFDAKAERGPVFAALLLDFGSGSAPVERALRDYRRRVVERWSRELRGGADVEERRTRALVVVLIGGFEAAARQWWYGSHARRADLEDAFRLVLRATIQQASVP